MAKQHTPEPYDIVTYENCTMIHSDDGVIAEFSCCDHEANARRFVACAHACKGIPTEIIEHMHFDRILSAISPQSLVEAQYDADELARE